MQPRFQKLNSLNYSVLLSFNTKFGSLNNSIFASLGLEFGHFSMKHLIREHLLMACNIAMQKPRLRLVRHFYKKHLHLTMRLDVILNSAAKGFALEQTIFKLFGAMDLLRTFKQRRRVTSSRLDLRVRHSFKTAEIKPFYDPNVDEIFLPFNMFLYFQHIFGRLDYRKLTVYLRMLKVPVVLFKRVRPALYHEDSIFSLSYNYKNAR